MSDTPTPRTDEFMRADCCDIEHCADFARDLERELAEAENNNAMLKKCLLQMQEAAKQLSDTRRELAEARELAGPIDLELISRLKAERDDAREDRDAWKESCANYHAANADLLKERNAMLGLLRRIARKGEFMDREGLRITVSDWLSRHHLLSENANSPDAGATE